MPGTEETPYIDSRVALVMTERTNARVDMFKLHFDDSGLKRLSRNLDSLSRPRNISFAELFHPKFMARTTRFQSFEALLDASGFTVQSAEDFAAIPDAEWDRFIAANTSFRSWKDMQQAAGAEWVKKQLNKR